jgi:hypothetical protein
MKTILRLLFAALVCAVPAMAQTTAITGTFKTPAGMTPVQAGVAPLAAVNGITVYGRADFDPFDQSGNRATRLVCNGVTYLPQTVHGWILGDGTLADSTALQGTISLVQTKGCQPANVVYRAVYALNGTADSLVKAVSWTEFKEIPQMALVDWSALSPVSVSKSAFSYVLQNQGSVLDFLNWIGTTGPGVPPLLGDAQVWFDSQAGVFRCQAGASGSVIIDCAPFSGSASFDVENPSATDSGIFQHKWHSKIHFTRITCSVDSGTVSINFDIRTESNPNGSGTPVLPNALACTPTTALTTTFSSASVIGESPVALIITGTTGAPAVVRVHAEYSPN